MKYLLILAIVFISLCVGLPIELPQLGQTPITQEPGVSIIDQGSPDIYLSIQTIPLEVRQGRTLTLIFEIRNKNTFDLEDVEVMAYDTCIFDYDDSSERTASYRDIDTLSPNETETWTWEWITGSTELEKDCEIKFKTEYIGNFSLFQDIAILSESEYKIRQLEGTLQNVPIRSYSSKTPLKITLTFPENQPFLEDITGYSMYIDYYNIGIGFITVNKEDIEIDIPGNIENQELDCGDYYTSEGVLNKDLRFIKNKALRTTCDFKTIKVGQPIDIKSLSLTANYKYVLDNSISVRVKR